MKLFWRAPLILMLIFATGNLVSPSATAYGITDYILSGGKSISDPIHVDDDLQILLSDKVIFSDNFEKGQYLKLNAKRTTVAAYCALALDLIGRGLFGVTMPENILDGTHPLITELFTTIKSNHAGELGAFGYALTTKDYAGAIKHLARFITSTKKSKNVMLKLIREVFGPEHSVRYASFMSKNLTDIIFAFKPVKLLTEITYWTFKAPTEGYARLEAIGQLPIKEPHYTREKAQKEAKQYLATIRTLEEAYRAENDTYSKSLEEMIDLTTSNIGRDYKYRILKASKDYFLAEATGITPFTKGDRWAIDHEGKIFQGAEIDERVSKLEEIEKNREQKGTEELEKKRKKRIYQRFER